MRPTATSLLLDSIPPPPPPISEVRALGSGIGEARTPAMRDVLPSEGSFDRWFDALHAPEDAEGRPAVAAPPPPTRSMGTLAIAAMVLAGLVVSISFVWPLLR